MADHHHDPEICMTVRTAHACGMHLNELDEGPFTADTVRRWIALADKLGVISIAWAAQYVGTATYPSRVMNPMRPVDDAYLAKRQVPQVEDRWAGSKQLFNPIAENLAQFDTLKVALGEARRRGLRFYASVQFFDLYFPALENDFFEDNPQHWILGRDQKRAYRGIPCYGEPAVQEYWLSLIGELAARGVDGVSMRLQSHVQGSYWHGAEVPPDGELEPDSFSYNPAVVAAYEQRHGVNILDAPADPEKLCALQGDQFTAFLTRVRRKLGPEKRLIAATPTQGVYGFGGAGGACLGAFDQRAAPPGEHPSYQFEMQWQQWIDRRLIDALIVYNPGPGAVAEVQQTVKALAGDCPVWLQRRWDPQKTELDELAGEFTAIAGGDLDGYNIFELNCFLMPDWPLKPLLLKLNADK